MGVGYRGNGTGNRGANLIFSGVVNHNGVFRFGEPVSDHDDSNLEH